MTGPSARVYLLVATVLSFAIAAPGLARTESEATPSAPGLNLLQRGWTLQSAELLSQAKTHFADCLRAKPQDSSCGYFFSTACLYLAEICRETGKKEEAERVLDSGIDQMQKTLAQKETAQGHSLLADLYGQSIALRGGLAGARLGRRVAAENNRALELDPSDARVYASLGRQYYFTPAFFGGSVNKAIEAFRHSLTLNPNSDETLVWLALAYQKAGDHVAFESTIRQALQINPQCVLAKRLSFGR